jgi:hypothetical protein
MIFLHNKFFATSCFWLGGLGGLLLLASLGCRQLHEGGAMAKGPGVFFVAAEGNDAWTGTKTKKSSVSTVGPVATLNRALTLARQYKATQNAGKPVIYLADGKYFISKPLLIDATLNGLEIAALPKANPVISGGRKITGWQLITRDGKALWAVELPEVRAGQWYFHQLWINGARQTRARHPNQGYLKVTGLPAADGKTDWTAGQAQFQFKEGDLHAWPSIQNAEVCVMNRWVESHLPILKVDETTRTVTFSKRSVFQLEVNDLYYLENAIEALDQPGEWYLEQSSGMLYYWPRPGEIPERQEVIAPVLSQLVRLEGSAAQPVVNVQWRGVTFAHTEWYFPGGFDTGANKVEISPPPKAEVGGFAQAAVGVSGAVWGQFVKQCVFEKCAFLHLGGYALELAKGCQQNLVSGCEMGDLAAGGVKLGETVVRAQLEDQTSGNEISDCHIHDGGRIFHSAIGVWLGQTPSNRLLHNHIHDFYYTGISMGWTWGYDQALATNNLVEFNHVHHIGVLANGDGPILSDMAGIYTLGLQEGSMIRNNLWHDCAGIRYGGWGIYFDEGTTHILAENNLVYRTTHGGFHQHYGKENLVQNNIFALARDFQIQRSRVESHRSFTFAHNLVYWQTGRPLEGNFSSNHLFQANLYWHEGGGDLLFANRTFDEWQKGGQDAGSVIADPLFVDPTHGNFAFKPGSPAEKVGFKPFDLSQVGPRPGKGRK